MRSGQILTLIKILTCVPLHRERHKRATNSTCQLAHCGSKEKASGFARSPRSTRGPSLTFVTVRSLLEFTFNPTSFSDIRDCQIPL